MFRKQAFPKLGGKNGKGLKVQKTSTHWPSREESVYEMLN